MTGDLPGGKFKSSGIDEHVYGFISAIFNQDHGLFIFGAIVVLIIAAVYFKKRYDELKVKADYFNREQLEDIEERRRLAWELRQAKLQEEAEIALEKKKEIEKKKELDRLEDMEAASQGRTSKAKPKVDTKDWRDGGAWSTVSGRGGGTQGQFKPSGFKRRGG